MRPEKIQGGLFLLLCLLLFMPLAQQKLHFVSGGKLDGAVRNSPPAKFSLSTWFDGSYQEAQTKYLNDSMGFRPALVRLNNQLDFSLFNKIHAQGVVAGPGNYLYEKGYIDMYCSMLYTGDTQTRSRLIKLKLVQDTLQRLGKSVIVVHAPSKAWYYPDHFPSFIHCDTTGHSTYKDYLRLEDSLHINRIDFNAWFAKMRPRSTHLLMAKQSTHWTLYGALLAADSLTRRIEQMQHIKMAHVSFTRLQLSDSAQYTDNDIAKGMNLLFAPAKETFTYPEVQFITGADTRKPNAIYMGDSFFWTFIYDHIPANVNNDWLFWYAWGDIWYRKNGQEGISSADQFDWTAALSNADYIVLLSSEVNLNRLGNGFIEKAYKHYYPRGK